MKIIFIFIVTVLPFLLLFNMRRVFKGTGSTTKAFLEGFSFPASLAVAVILGFCLEKSPIFPKWLSEIMFSLLIGIMVWVLLRNSFYFLAKKWQYLRVRIYSEKKKGYRGVPKERNFV